MSFPQFEKKRYPHVEKRYPHPVENCGKLSVIVEKYQDLEKTHQKP